MDVTKASLKLILFQMDCYFVFSPELFSILV